MSVFELRTGTADDIGFLSRMLHEAAFWRPDVDHPPLEDALARPALGRYVAGWGRDGDRALVATADGEPVGAAWYRLFPDDDPGYGFVDATVPELSLAVVASRRRLGVGRALLAALVAQAQLDDHLALSLSVEPDNPARHLYEGLGFAPVEADGADEADASSTLLLRFGLR